MCFGIQYVEARVAHDSDPLTPVAGCLAQNVNGAKAETSNIELWHPTVHST